MVPGIHHIIRLLSCVGIFCTTAEAQPSLVSSQVILDQKIYRDVKVPGLYYYVPADYKLMTDTDGKPSFTLTEMRYTGTRSTGDAGISKFNNLLQFRVVADPSLQRKMTEIRTLLRNTNPAAELRPLPVRRFSSLLTFAGTSGEAAGDSLYLIKTSFSEATDEAAAGNNSYWNDRIINLRLNNNDAQLVESALRNHQSVMSFSYAMYTVFSERGLDDLTVSGNGEIARQVYEVFANEVKNQKDSALNLLMVKANAFVIAPDPDKWSSVIQKVDINEKVPAKYPLFDVYCYDFNNDLRPDLFAKKIEIKATSVNGSDIISGFTFKGSKPDIYAKSIRFIYAVRFDKPFYYRVTEINTDGEPRATGWLEKKEWSEILDITSPPDKIIPGADSDNQ
ncbi:MAG: hypothetical protein HYZ15_15125 [Sphingobacteriales bacterium]|nr:hypothetical protein [Sphingobacteriales bacterium]